MEGAEGFGHTGFSRTHWHQTKSLQGKSCPIAYFCGYFPVASLYRLKIILTHLLLFCFANGTRCDWGSEELHQWSCLHHYTNTGQSGICQISQRDWDNLSLWFGTLFLVGWWQHYDNERNGNGGCHHDCFLNHCLISGLPPWLAAYCGSESRRTGESLHVRVANKICDTSGVWMDNFRRVKSRAFFCIGFDFQKFIIILESFYFEKKTVYNFRLGLFLTVNRIVIFKTCLLHPSRYYCIPVGSTYQDASRLKGHHHYSGDAQ